ncbi:MAG TPA: hypothetical protein VMS02_06595 [Solirubrobacteraceae bacterium]|nr:hypothetical protein [Solirubrobacteraceae bacterium]
MGKKGIAALSLAIALASVLLCAPAFAYRIETKGAEAKGEDVQFTVGEEVSFVCAKAVFKQPNTTGKELVTEEQSLITTFSECAGKFGSVPIEVTITPEAKFIIGPGEKTSETTWDDIPITFEKEIAMKVVAKSLEAECTVKVPAEKDLKELTWKNLNTKPGEYKSEFTLSMHGEATDSGGGCERMLKKPKPPWLVKTVNPPTQAGEISP